MTECVCVCVCEYVCLSETEFSYENFVVSPECTFCVTERAPSNTKVIANRRTNDPDFAAISRSTANIMETCTGETNHNLPFLEIFRGF